MYLFSMKWEWSSTVISFLQCFIQYIFFGCLCNSGVRDWTKGKLKKFAKIRPQCFRPSSMRLLHWLQLAGADWPSVPALVTKIVRENLTYFICFLYSNLFHNVVLFQKLYNFALHLCCSLSSNEKHSCAPENSWEGEKCGQNMVEGSPSPSNLLTALITGQTSAKVVGSKSFFKVKNITRLLNFEFWTGAPFIL